MKKNIWLQTILILFLSFSSGFVFNHYSENGISLLYKPLELKAGSQLNADETFRVLREGQSLFIDSRYVEEFAVSHIPGSINISSKLSRDELMKALEPIPKNQQIVVYCSSNSCQSARRLAGLMVYLGYENVHVYLAGFKDWLEKGYPVEREFKIKD